MEIIHLDTAAQLIHAWINGKTDYRQQILFDLPTPVYEMLLTLSVEDISTALEDLTFCESNQNEKILKELRNNMYLPKDLTNE